MKNLVLVFTLISISFTASFSQSVLDNLVDGAYKKETVKHREPTPYPALREADVMWSRKIWREIDLRQKINHPFYYPAVAPGQEEVYDRRSLISVVMDAIVIADCEMQCRALITDKDKDGNILTNGTLKCSNCGEQVERQITPFGNAIYDDEFKVPMTQTEIESIGGAKKEIRQIYDWAKDDGSEKDTLIIEEFDRTSVKMWRVKEEWYFDKQRSVMDVRIIGLCPLQEAKDEFGELTGGYAPLFWIYFPQARNVFANAEVFNMMKNDAERRTYDDIFFKRMFSSYIIKEANVMNRKIQQYMLGLDALLEAERIKEEIFNIEHDLWEY